MSYRYVVMYKTHEPELKTFARGNLIFAFTGTTHTRMEALMAFLEQHRRITNIAQVTVYTYEEFRRKYPKTLV